MIDFEIVVIIPGLAFAMPQLNEPNTTFNQPAGDEQLPGLDAVSVGFQHMFWFLLDVKGVGRFHLHSISEFERVNPGFECRFVGPLIGMLSVQFLQQIELPPLLAPGGLVIANVFDQFFDVTMPRIDVRSLKNTWKKRGSPVLCPGDWQTIRTHGNETGQILVFGPQTIGDP